RNDCSASPRPVSGYPRLSRCSLRRSAPDFMPSAFGTRVRTPLIQPPPIPGGMAAPQDQMLSVGKRAAKYQSPSARFGGHFSLDGRKSIISETRPRPPLPRIFDARRAFALSLATCFIAAFLLSSAALAAEQKTQIAPPETLFLAELLLLLLVARLM